MGGSVFKQSGLDTPRMPEHVYTYTCKRAEDLLRKHFLCFGHATEAPAKENYGDVDIFVALPVDEGLWSGDEARNGALLSFLLGGKEWKHTQGSTTYHVAVKWPGEDDFQKENKAKAAKPKDKKTELTAINTNVIDKNKYIQVDIQLCPTIASFDWHIFFQAHGDLWSILGGIIRPYGLTCNSTGLHLRIEEVEKHNKAQSRVLMTDHPDKVLKYLGLDADAYGKPFKSRDALMAYVASCRFHDPMREISMRGKNEERVEKRKMYAAWSKEYLPAHKGDTPGSSAGMSRQEVIKDARKFFGDEFGKRFEEQKKKAVREIKEEDLWTFIRSLPGVGADKADKTYTTKGMKREIKGKIEEVPERHRTGIEGVRQAFKDGRFDDVKRWAEECWRSVMERQKRVDEMKSRANLLEKKKKDAAEKNGAQA
ncbi:hypothetical protein PV05_02129 [Exophiala xenobiotica]|uniref:Uncharacterized protein n=1 Tax=Exophiala xenobiotica TaxID=348802 RepID=A0A0D2F2B6_9EURO|nr:uncharacterized protein PV05_02129 [Exophiala xenobiotica]KIW62078.1 hypothetical protein PV05_02129 [Exophiala xenobiotica]